MRRSMTLVTTTSPPHLLRATGGPPTLRPQVTQKSHLHRSTRSTTLRLLARLLCEYQHTQLRKYDVPEKLLVLHQKQIVPFLV